MGLLNRHILVRIAVPSLLAVAVIGLIAVANEIQEQVQKLPMAQVTLGDVTRLMFYLLPTLVPYVVWVTYMMGILLAFSGLSQHNEIVAMQAAGIPLKRIILPVIVTGAVLSVAAFWVQDRVQPWAVAKVYQLVSNDLPLRVTLDALQPGIMHEFRGWRVYIGSKDRDTKTLHNIVVLRSEEGKQGTVVFHADSARLAKRGNRSYLEMPNGHYIPSAEGKTLTPLTFDGLTMALPEIRLKPQPETRHGMTLAQLLAREKRLEKEYRRTRSALLKREVMREREEIADRVSLPFACLAVSFVAAPLGARARRSGRSYTFAIGFTIVLVYYVLKLLMEPRSLHSLSTIVLRTWTPNLLLCAVGVIFVWRVDRT